MNETYQDLLRRKDLHVPPTGIAGAVVDSPHLFPFQRDLTQWALRRGRAALFADTGLGKTRQQLIWADAVAAHTGGRVLILAPLAVATTGTVPEGENIGVDVRYAREQGAATRITVTNYDMLQHFDPDAFEGVVLDESSILKDETAKTRTEIIRAFARTPFRLACTATPSPNDFTELGNHAEFLGVMRHVEMLAQFFTHDGGSTQDWHLKGHAREKFWRWVCSWAALVKSPADLGYDAGAYELPPLVMHDHIVRATRHQAMASGKLFAEPASTLTEQRAARRASMSERVSIAASLAAAEPGEPWIFWCELNDESEALAKAIPDAVEVRGSMSREEKEDALLYFATGRTRVLVSKPSICGFGLNWQHCARAAFVGVSHSFEQWYQAVRRNWRFGQRREVHCHVITSELEGDVLANLRRKEADARKLAEEMRRYTAAIVRENVRGAERESDAYEPTVIMKIPKWIKSDRSRA
jgi:superfamily II DNA or RNA helicase